MNRIEIEFNYSNSPTTTHSLYKFEDSTPRQPDGPPVGIKYEGKIWDPTISAEVEKQEKKLHYLGNKDQASEESFRYVLLVPTRVASGPDGTGPLKTEINVVPVRDFVLFSKPSVMKMKTLDELDDDFETKMQRDKRKLSEYTKIAKGLSRLSKAGGGAGGDGDSDAEETGASMAELFGLAANSKLKKGIKRGSNAKKFLDENGVDIDAQKRMGEDYAGDYDASFANNEHTFADESADFMQQQEEDRGMVEMTKTSAFMKKGNEGGQSDDDDDNEADSEEDESDDEEPANRRRALAANAASSGEAADALINDKDLQQARVTGRVLNSAARLNEGDLKPRTTASNPGESAAGRTRGETAAAAAATPGSKRKGTEPVEHSVGAISEGGGTAKRVKTEEVVDNGGGAFELTDEGVRRYMLQQGGRVTLENVKHVFKAQVKSLNKSTTSGDTGRNRWVFLVFKLVIITDVVDCVFLRGV